jgi:hypothetical protein
VLGTALASQPCQNNIFSLRLQGALQPLGDDCPGENWLFIRERRSGTPCRYVANESALSLLLDPKKRKHDIVHDNSEHVTTPLLHHGNAPSPAHWPKAAREGP